MRVLLIEDEVETADAIASFLRIKNIDVEVALTFSQAETSLDNNPPDVVILDIHLPDGNGIKWLEHNAEILSQTALVVVSAHHFEGMRIRALELGADVFLRKPVSVLELHLQIQNLAARMRLDDSALVPDSSWRLLLKQWFLVSPGEVEVKLSLSEIRLLKTLGQACFEPVERDQIIKGLQEDPNFYDQRRLETMIRRLRQKVSEHTPNESFPLMTVRGIGYSFKAPMRLISD